MRHKNPPIFRAFAGAAILSCMAAAAVAESSYEFRHPAKFSIAAPNLTETSPPPSEPAVRRISLGDDGVRSWNDGSLAQSCADYRGSEGAAYAGDTGSGLYRISTPSLPSVVVYCDMESEGGGWTLVRRLSPTSPTAYPVNDNLIGGKGFGTYQPDPQAVATFGLKFSDIEFTEFRLDQGVGQKWLRFGKGELLHAPVAGCEYRATITASYLSATPYETRWCFRTTGITEPSVEDPWISANWGDASATFYAENAYSWPLSDPSRGPGGLNAYIR